MRASNLFTVSGNIGGPVEIRDAAGVEVARLSVAESVVRLRSETGQFEVTHTNWIPITAFGSLAKRAASGLKKGDRVTVIGSIKTTSFEKDGENRKGFELIADSIERTQILAKATPIEKEIAADFGTFDEFIDPGFTAKGDPRRVK